MIASKAAGLRLWPHRVTALVVLLVLSERVADHQIYDVWSTLGFGVVPYVALEAVGRIPSSRGAELFFLAGSLCLCAGAVLYAKWFWGGSGEWSVIMYFFVPAAQTAGVAVLGVLVTILRLWSARRG